MGGVKTGGSAGHARCVYLYQRDSDSEIEREVACLTACAQRDEVISLVNDLEHVLINEMATIQGQGHHLTFASA